MSDTRIIADSAPDPDDTALLTLTLMRVVHHVSGLQVEIDQQTESVRVRYGRDWHEFGGRTLAWRLTGALEEAFNDRALHPPRPEVLDEARQTRDAERAATAEAAQLSIQGHLMAAQRALAEAQAERDALQAALLRLIRAVPGGEAGQDWSSWRVGFSRGVHRGKGATSGRQLASAVEMALDDLPRFLPPLLPGQGEAERTRANLANAAHAETLERLQAAEAALAARPAGPAWQHQGSWGVYEEVGRGLLESSGGPVAEGTRLVVYRSELGELFARPEAEFEDGRFTRLLVPLGYRTRTGDRVTLTLAQGKTVLYRIGAYAPGDPRSQLRTALRGWLKDRPAESGLWASWEATDETGVTGGEIWHLPAPAPEPAIPCLFERDYVHTWFSLTYASYAVFPRTLLQSMPPAWQAQFVYLVTQLEAAFSALPRVPGYHVEVGEWHAVEDLSAAQLEALRWRTLWPAEDGEAAAPEYDPDGDEVQYLDPDGDSQPGHTSVFIPQEDPIPAYNRGRTKIAPDLVAMQEVRPPDEDEDGASAVGQRNPPNVTGAP
jgi:hypothetical protein